MFITLDVEKITRYYNMYRTAFRRRKPNLQATTLLLNIALLNEMSCPVTRTFCYTILYYRIIL